MADDVSNDTGLRGKQGFLELLAVNVLNLYRALMVRQDDPSPFIRRLRDELHNPMPGDLVVEVSNHNRPHGSRIGLLEAIVQRRHADMAVVQRINGDRAWLGRALIIKVPREVFAANGHG